MIRNNMISDIKTHKNPTYIRICQEKILQEFGVS